MNEKNQINPMLKKVYTGINNRSKDPIDCQKRKNSAVEVEERNKRGACSIRYTY